MLCAQPLGFLAAYEGAPGLDAHRERIDRHKKKRGKKKVREEALDENPLKNIKNTLDISLVVKDGKVYEDPLEID